MKKFAISILTAGLLISSNLYAQENAGGTYSSKYSIGQMTLPQIAAAAAAAAVAAATIANSNGSVKTRPPVECPDGQELVAGACVPVEPVYTCAEGDQPPVDGVCIGTASTVTITGTGTGTNTGTATITVPVTFTYAPALVN
ncbi:hypothetical protein [Flavobacterium sp. W21_SRS_FM6]|uniref:hypothetical protein n=1 Tax=Flavobacterium sp. W21_SRS_FM6 TaxID=3240268 RepID=UPI003F8D9478